MSVAVERWGCGPVRERNEVTRKGPTSSTVHSSLFLYFHSLLIHSRRRREGGARYTIRYGPLSLRRSDRVAPLRGSRLRRVVRGQPKERGSERRRLTPSQERRKAWM